MTAREQSAVVARAGARAADSARHTQALFVPAGGAFGAVRAHCGRPTALARRAGLLLRPEAGARLRVPAALASRRPHFSVGAARRFEVRAEAPSGSGSDSVESGGRSGGAPCASSGPGSESSGAGAGGIGGKARKFAASAFRAASDGARKYVDDLKSGLARRVRMFLSSKTNRKRLKRLVRVLVISVVLACAAPRVPWRTFPPVQALGRFVAKKGAATIAALFFEVLVIFAVLFTMWRNGPFSSFSNSNARLFLADTGVSFGDVAGADDVKEELQEIVHFLKNPKAYRDIGAVLPKGVLLAGPSGTGKTLLAKAVAGEAGVPFFSISGSEFVEMYVGVGATRMRNLFKEARKRAPCIVFIDEIDAVGGERGGGGGSNPERDQTLNQLLTAMDGFEGGAESPVVVLAATNRPEVLDPALRRPGRFDRQVLVDAPDRAGRAAILRVHTRKLPLGACADLEAVAARTVAFTGAALAAMCNEAALLAVRRGSRVVEQQDLVRAADRALGGLERRGRALSDAHRRALAAGHALVARLVSGLVGPGELPPSERVTLLPRAAVAGAAPCGGTGIDDGAPLLGEDALRGQLARILAGRAAEEIVFGRVTTLSQGNIRSATTLAERAVTRYGFSRAFGPLSLEASRPHELGVNPGPEIRSLLAGAYGAAKAAVEANREALEATVEGAALDACLAGAAPPPELGAFVAQGRTPSDSAAPGDGAGDGGAGGLAEAMRQMQALFGGGPGGLPPAV
eukprot:tig00021275_g19884.t1